MLRRCVNSIDQLLTPYLPMESGETFLDGFRVVVVPPCCVYFDGQSSSAAYPLPARRTHPMPFLSPTISRRVPGLLRMMIHQTKTRKSPPVSKSVVGALPAPTHTHTLGNRAPRPGPRSPARMRPRPSPPPSGSIRPRCPCFAGSRPLFARFYRQYLHSFRVGSRVGAREVLYKEEK